MDEEFPPYYVKEVYEVFDRFTFDALFRRLLFDGYDHEEAKDIIMHHCALSALVSQERIHNRYYLRLSEHVSMADDLLELKREVYAKALNSQG
ncbi:MAG: hypothetical protein JW955_14740 [Sedimentisphaerales bacterium]|nr:hypothetical protein [Sedimentisphaerales bacterium]